MRYNQTIRKIFASILLVIFAFSITPQKNIHDFLAAHVDTTSNKAYKISTIEHLEPAGFHCSYDQLVATSPFVPYTFDIALSTLEIEVVKNNIPISFSEITYISHFDSRGPPSI